MTDARTYIKVHDGMPEHPKVEALSDGAFRLLVSCWCYCSRNLTDGRITNAAWAKRGTPKVRRELMAAGLVEPRDGFVQMHDYLEHQRSADEVAAMRRKRADAGRKGGQARANGLASARASAKQKPKQTPSTVSSKNVAVTEELPNGSSQTDPSLREGGSDSSLRSESARSDEKTQVNAGQIVKAWIDRQRRRPAERVVGAVAKNVRELLDQRFSAHEIDAGLDAMTAKGLHPSTLPSLVSAAANGSGSVHAIRPEQAHLSRQQVDDILGPDTETLPQPPVDPADDFPAYQAWLRQARAERATQREHLARRQLEHAR